MRGTWLNSPLSYALGMFAMMVPTQAFSAFYSYYYVEKLGLGVGLATLARTIYLIWDAVNQPLFGHWSDRTRTRFGRRKPWIWASIPLFMMTFCMIFAVPQGLAQHQNSLFLWFLVALLLFEAVSTVIWVNYGALFPEPVPRATPPGEGLRNPARLPDRRYPNRLRPDSDSVRRDGLRLYVPGLRPSLRRIHAAVHGFR